MTASRAWLAVTVGSLTFVLFTSNGGVTWTKSGPVGLGGPAALSFSDNVDGWLLQSLGAATGSEWVALYRSVDSGLRWSLVAETPPPPAYGTSRGGLPTGCDKTGVTFRSPRTGWLTGACAAGHLVLVSTDAGLRWSPQRLPVMSSACLAGCFINPPEFLGRTGFVTFSHYPAVAYLLISTDGGASWQLRHLPAGAGPYPQIRFFSPRQGIIVSAGAQGTFGRVFYVTANGGKTWTAVPQGRRFTELGAGVDFVSTRTGYAWINGADVTSGGPPDMYETTNSGVTWQPFAPRLG